MIFSDNKKIIQKSDEQLQIKLIEKQNQQQEDQEEDEKKEFNQFENFIFNEFKLFCLYTSDFDNIVDKKERSEFCKYKLINLKPNSINQKKTWKNQINKKNIFQKQLTYHEQKQQHADQKKTNVIIHLVGNQQEIENLFVRQKNDKDFSMIFKNEEEQNNIKLYFKPKEQQKQLYNKTQSKQIFQTLNKLQFQVKDWSLGAILETNQPKSTILNKFYTYFTIRGANKVINHENEATDFKLTSSLWIFADPKSNQQNIEIITEMFNGFELKISFTYKQCQQFFYNFSENYGEDEGEREQKTHNLFFQLLYPPKFFLKKIQQNDYTSPYLLNYDWNRVQNFTLLEQYISTEQPMIDELTRLFLFNNSILSLRISDKYIKQNPVHQMNLQNIKKSFQNFKIFDANIQFTYYNKQKRILLLKNFEKSYNYIESFNCSPLNFESKYLILVGLSNNRIHLTEIHDLLNFLSKEKNENMFQRALRMTVGQSRSNIQNKFLNLLQSNYLVISQQKNILKGSGERGMEEVENEEIFLENFSEIRRIQINPSGILYHLKDIEMDSRLLRQFKNEKEFLIRVQFLDDNLEKATNLKIISKKLYRQYLNNLTVLDRKYAVLGWSASQLRNSSCWFYSEQANCKSLNQIYSELGNFENIYIPAKKAARIGQSFASSLPYPIKQNVIIQDNDELKEIYEKDEQNNDLDRCFTDGIGKISPKLLEQIQLKFHYEQLCSIQFRLGGAKGVLTKDPYFLQSVEIEQHQNQEIQQKQEDQQQQLKSSELVIQLRNKQIKYKVAQKYQDLELEILDVNKYRPGYLNRQLILLLNSLGVPDKVFLDLQDEYLVILNKFHLIDASIYKYFTSATEDDKIIAVDPVIKLIRKAINLNINIHKEPFFQGVIQTLRARAYLFLRKKQQILVKQAARLMGVIDEYGILHENEVYCAISEDNNDIEVIEGSVVIGKNPTLHCGDIRVLTAVDAQTIKQRCEKKFKNIKNQNMFEHLVNVLVFPVNGKVPITSQISGSDLDGDHYFISWDQRLIPKKENLVEPFNYSTAKNPLEIQKKPVTYEQMLDFFIMYLNYETLGKIDNSHLSLADQLEGMAKHPTCVELAKLHAEAVDFNKTGIKTELPQEFIAYEFPDFMEKEGNFKEVYNSKRVMGQLYQNIIKLINSENNKQEVSVENNERNSEIDVQLLFLNIQIRPEEISDQNQNLNYFNNSDNDDKNVFSLKSQIEEACQIYKQYCQEIMYYIDYFGVENEFEIYSGNFQRFSKLYRPEKINFEKEQRRIIDRAIQIQEKYKKLFFQGLPADNEPIDNIYNNYKLYSEEARQKASLWYFICIYNEENKSLLDQLTGGQTESSIQDGKIENVNQLEKIIYIIKEIKENSSYQEIKSVMNKRQVKKIIGLAWYCVPSILFENKRKFLLKVSDYNQLQSQQQQKSINSSQNSFSHEIQENQKEENCNSDENNYI